MASFSVFLVAYVLSQFFRSFLAVIAPELSVELDLGGDDLGRMSAAWFAAFALAQPLVGWILDRFGPRRSVPPAMVLAALGSLVFATAAGPWQCAIAMALIGLGCAPVYMGALYGFGRTHHPARFAFLSSWLLGLGSAGNLLAATPLAWLTTLAGWRLAFLIVALATVLAACLLWAVVRDPPPAAATGPTGTAFAELAGIAAMRPLWPLLPLTLVSYAVVVAERGLWIGPYLREVHGLDAIARGNAALAMAAAMSLGALLYGPLDRLVDSRKWVVVTGTVVTAAAYLTLGLHAGTGVLAASALLTAIGGFGMTYGVLMAHARAFFPDRLLGRGITFMNLLFIGGAGLIQPLSGNWVASMTAKGLAPTLIYGGLHVAFGTALALTGLIYLLSTDRRPSDPD
jgi:MFS family permease